MYVTNLGYPEPRLPHFTELPDSNTKVSNKTSRELDNAIGIADNDDKHILNLFNLEAK